MGYKTIVKYNGNVISEFNPSQTIVLPTNNKLMNGNIELSMIETADVLWLYNNGNEYTSITGGWVAYSNTNSSSGYKSSACWKTTNSIDVSKYPYMTIVAVDKFTVYNGNNHMLGWYWDGSSYDDATARIPGSAYCKRIGNYTSESSFSTLTMNLTGASGKLYPIIGMCDHATYTSSTSTCTKKSTSLYMYFNYAGYGGDGEIAQVYLHSQL